QTYKYTKPGYLMSTNPITFTPLSAITRSPSLVGIMFRTTPPPAGIAHDWNCSVFGSKRTIVFGETADSEYQMMSLSAVMPYGCDFAPLGDAYSFTAPVFGSSLPRKPRE